MSLPKLPLEIRIMIYTEACLQIEPRTVILRSARVSPKVWTTTRQPADLTTLLSLNIESRKVAQKHYLLAFRLAPAVPSPPIRFDFARDTLYLGQERVYVCAPAGEPGTNASSVLRFINRGDLERVTSLAIDTMYLQQWETEMEDLANSVGDDYEEHAIDWGTCYTPPQLELPSFKNLERLAVVVGCTNGPWTNYLPRNSCRCVNCIKMTAACVENREKCDKAFTFTDMYTDPARLATLQQVLQHIQSLYPAFSVPTIRYVTKE